MGNFCRLWCRNQDRIFKRVEGSSGWIWDSNIWNGKLNILLYFQLNLIIKTNNWDIVNTQVSKLDYNPSQDDA